MTNAVYPKAKMGSGCPTGKLVVVVVVAMVVAAPTLLYEPYDHPQLRTVDKPMEANPLADDGVAPATTVEVERCGDATLAALGAANAVPGKSPCASTRTCYRTRSSNNSTSTAASSS